MTHSTHEQPHVDVARDVSSEDREKQYLIHQAAQRATEARGYRVNPDSLRHRRHNSRGEYLDSIANELHTAAPPVRWAYWFSLELAEKGGFDNARQKAVEEEIMRAFEAHAETLPLRGYAAYLRLPLGRPLPAKWKEGCFLFKPELRAWIIEHIPELKHSALIAELPGESGIFGEDLNPGFKEVKDDTSDDEILHHLVGWEANARQIAESILEENRALRKLNILQIAERVRVIMENQHKRGQPGMTNRSGNIPNAGTIKRHALTGIKN